MYQNHRALDATLMELTLSTQKQGLPDVVENVRGALWGIGKNAGHVKQGLANLRSKSLKLRLC
ncbi:hypothetical protein ND528_03345 [Pseudomonas sp. C98]|uniref:Uncharacterized protein n=1 Tax=Pseudomonas mercuritolerans TaxID=2951809 RepID=A0ABT2XPL0_9PSED|nr:hypothetical protein [Pseudomonas mercuritolerans]